MACAWRIVVDIEDIGNAGAVVQPINWVVGESAVCCW